MCLKIRFSGSELAMEVCLMLTEVYITTYQLDKAVRYIEFIESELLMEERDSKGMEGCRSKLSLFKARLSLHHGNVKACKRDIKNFSTLAGNVRPIASKYTDLPVFLLNSEHKDWQNFENAEKLGRLCTYIIYGDFVKYWKSMQNTEKWGNLY